MIIHSIPFLSNSYVKNTISKSSCEWHEIRLDYHKNPKSLHLDLVDEKTILTLRDSIYGGKFHFTIEEKNEIYNHFAVSKNCLIDIEIEHNVVLFEKRLILSHHQFECFDLEKLLKIVSLSNQLPSKFLKIAIPINHYYQFLQIQKIINHSCKPVIFVGMGKLGKISRYLYLQLGSVATYITSSEHPTATGQISITEMNTVNLQNISTKTKIGGLIGGKQVYHSHGIRFYNKYFQSKAIDACYLPFEVEDITDFRTWLNESGLENQTYGFSVTMPHKASFYDFSLNSAVNFVHFPAQFTTNTDVLSFRYWMKYLEVSKNHLILVLGSGGSAEAFLRSFHKTHNISLYSRNKEKVKELSGKYLINALEIEELVSNIFSLLVNCTPLGMNGEDVLAEIPIKKIDKVIDLPYGKIEIPLINYCKKNSLKFVDGDMFWQKQAEKQLELFLSNLTKNESKN